MGLFTEIEQLESKIANVPGVRIIGEINRLEYSLLLLTRNHKFLRDILEGIIKDHKLSSEIFSRKFRWKSDLLFKEISFRLHNFVASAQSLVDHSRRVYRKVYENKGKFDSYDKKVQTDLVDNGLIQFVQRLRQMCQHYHLPQVSAELRVGATSKMTLFIYKSELLGFDGWNKASKNFIDAHEEKIDLLSVTNDYFAQISAFHDWVKKEFLEMYSQELDDIKSIKNQINQKKKDLIIDEFREVFELEKGKRLERLKFVLSGCLTTLDLQELYQVENKPRTWIIRGVKKLQNYFDIPRSLIDKIEAECK